MDVAKIVAEIDYKIDLFHNVREALMNLNSLNPPLQVKEKCGRPKGVVNKPKVVVIKKKSRLTPSGRKNISEAMKKRWASKKKQLAKKAA